MADQHNITKLLSVVHGSAPYDNLQGDRPRIEAIPKIKSGRACIHIYVVCRAGALYVPVGTVNTVTVLQYKT